MFNLRRWLVVLLSFICVSGLHAEPQPLPFEKDVLAFEAMDKESFPPKNAVLFVGDSTFSRWKSIHEDLPEFTLINRGIGGTQMSDLLPYIDRIVIPYSPSVIVLQEGGNDIHAGKSPEQVLANITMFVDKIRSVMPEVPIDILGLVANTARWNELEKRKRFNELVTTYAAAQKNVVFIDLFDAFVDANGRPREKLFAEDHLHPSEAGYQRRVEFIRPVLQRQLAH